MSYIDKITNKDTGESRVISPAAEAVRVSNENYEGENLDEVLDEVAHAIEDAGQGDGTVTGVKIGSTTYDPTDGVVDLSSPMDNKQDMLTVGVNIDSEPTSNSSNPVTSGGVKEYTDNAIDEKLTEVTVNAIPSGDVAVIDNLTVGGSTNALSAEQGKVLKGLIDNVGNVSYTEDSGTIYVASGGYVDPTPRLSVTPASVSLSSNVNGTITKQIIIKGFNLTTQIIVVLVDESGYYSINKTTLSASGGAVILTYEPTASGSHSASLVISSGADAEQVVSVIGIASSPTINVSANSLSLTGGSGESVTGVVHVSGTGLTNPISVNVQGAGFSASPSIIAVQQALAGIDLEITFDGSADSGSATITLSSTGATSVTVSATYTAVQPAAVGEEVGNVAGLKFLVTNNTLTPGDSNEVSVQKASSTISGDIVIPSTVTDANGISYAVTSLATNAFQSCSNITSIIIPRSVTKAANSQYYTFQNCTSLVSIDFGGLNKIGEYGMQGCSSIQSVILPDTMTTIGGNCFVGCTSLHTIQIGTSSACQMGSIQAALMNACQSNASTKDSALRTIICYATTPPSFGNYDTGKYGYGLPTTFFTNNGVTGNGTLKVRSDVKSSYENASGHSVLWSYVPTIEDIEES